MNLVRFFAIPCALLAALFLAGCGRRRPVVNPPASAPYPGSRPPGTRAPASPSGLPASVARSPALPAQFSEQGMASWYGAQFNGRRTSDGEIYNMFQYTAAHRTLPFGAVVRVTNLNNGRHVDVRINDRGPFVANRIIDLSYAAAVALGMIGTGTARVQLRAVGGPNPAVGLFGVQVGAFQLEQNAEQLRERLAAHYSPVEIAEYDSPDGVYYRVRVGRVPNEQTARQLADEIHQQEQLEAVVVRLDD